nr:hypothetical protein [Tanacetum cinerariifolium]
EGKKVLYTLSFYKMEMDEISEGYITSCIVNGLEAYDGEERKKLFKKELIIALKGELYFVKFILNPEKDDSEPEVILGRSFLRLAHGVVDFAGGHLTQKEAKKEALVIRISQKFALLEKERHVIETMAYNDKYKKIHDEIWKDKVKLDGKNVKEEEDAVKKIKRRSIEGKNDLGAFIFPIREEMKKIEKGITMIKYNQAEVGGKLSNVLCQVGVTTIHAKFLILDIPIDHDAPIMVGQGYLYTMGSILNNLDRLFSTFNEACHQTFRAARFDVPRTAESDIDDEVEYVINRNRLQEHMTEKPDHRDPNAQDNMKHWDVINRMGCNGEIDDMLRIRLHEAGSDEEIFTSVAWIRAFNINEPIYTELCHEFYSTYEFDKVCIGDELQSKKIIRFRLGGRAYNLTLLEFARRLRLYQVTELDEEGFNVYFEVDLGSEEHFNAQDYWLSISREEHLGLSRSLISTIKNPILRVIHKMITYGLCQRITRKGAGTQKVSQICCGQFISKLVRKCRVLTEDVLGVPRVGIPRPPRASMQDLYDRMGRMEIHPEAIEHMECLSIWLGFIVFHCREPTTRLAMLSRSMTNTMSSINLTHHSISSSKTMMSSIEMTRDKGRKGARRISAKKKREWIQNINHD